MVLDGILDGILDESVQNGFRSVGNTESNLFNSDSGLQYQIMIIRLLNESSNTIQSSVESAIETRKRRHGGKTI